eukprot:scaffold840_cov344-Pavlova_lutheri.AAC.3
MPEQKGTDKCRQGRVQPTPGSQGQALKLPRSCASGLASLQSIVASRIGHSHQEVNVSRTERSRFMAGHSKTINACLCSHANNA